MKTNMYFISHSVCLAYVMIIIRKVKIKAKVKT